MSQSLVAPQPAAAIAPLPGPPSFSIVIPAYQAAGTIASAVRSALEQTVHAHEVIVVDDGSTDDLQGALDPFAGQITLLRKENGGAASARNAGANAARGDFVAVLDADDVFDPRRVAALGELAAARPDLDLVTTDTRFVVGGRVVGRFYAHNTFEVDDQRAAILRSCFVGGWPAVRRSRLHDIAGFDETLRVAHDWDCWLRLVLDGSQAGLIPEPYYDYSLDSSGLTSSRVTSLWERVRTLEKASANPALRPSERSVLAESLRQHRSQAARVETQAALFADGRRDGLRGIALARGIEPRTRLLALGALAAPSLARRLTRPDAAPANRLLEADPL
jgi:GT2 family glycosyltransferase